MDRRHWPDCPLSVMGEGGEEEGGVQTYYWGEKCDIEEHVHNIDV